MKDIINGGIYSVMFSGTSSSEFNGEHPALIIRTLKEDDIYLVVPFTTYTPEKMEKVRAKGYGMRLLSTNSIARIDKLQIINRRSIRNRWKNGGTFLKIDPNELRALNDKVNKYIELSSTKEYTEYTKYYDQYKTAERSFSEIYNGTRSDGNIFETVVTDNTRTIRCRKSDISFLSTGDVVEIAGVYYPLSNITIQKDATEIMINIQLET
jgi:mRNA-degrading endonuclease toxin of MazEF toxin-antitoxin module